MTTPGELSSVERDVLDFEREWWRHAADKESAVRERFGWEPTRHYLLLNRLVDRPAALAYDPLGVRRLRRMRAQRVRSAGSRGAGDGSA